MRLLVIGEQAKRSYQRWVACAPESRRTMRVTRKDDPGRPGSLLWQSYPRGLYAAAEKRLVRSRTFMALPRQE